MASGETKDDATPSLKPPRRSRAGVETREDNLGEALRGIYQNTVSEAVPSDLLDLLGKLD